jgi:hypothetical protein
MQRDVRRPVAALELLAGAEEADHDGTIRRASELPAFSSNR